jgi:DNA transposition AAA+ family ATPase
MNSQNQLNLSTEPVWHVAETKNYNTVVWYLDHAQMQSEVFGIVGNTGHSKTFAAKQYAAVTRNAWHVECKEHWNKKMFLQSLLALMHQDSSGTNIGEMMQQIVNYVRSLNEPSIIILDEADKLDDKVLYFFISLYNELEDKCGIIMLATDYLKKRIDRGVERNKKGYKEILSRLGGKFIVLAPNSDKDIEKICQANGLNEAIHITEAVNESKGDLRRVKRVIKKYSSKNKAA